jgi:hypothetical protein
MPVLPGTTTEGFVAAMEKGSADYWELKEA